MSQMIGVLYGVLLNEETRRLLLGESDSGGLVLRYELERERTMGRSLSAWERLSIGTKEPGYVGYMVSVADAKLAEKMRCGVMRSTSLSTLTATGGLGLFADSGGEAFRTAVNAWALFERWCWQVHKVSLTGELRLVVDTEPEEQPTMWMPGAGLPSDVAAAG
jgi:hypothetical protein